MLTKFIIFQTDRSFYAIHSVSVYNILNTFLHVLLFFQLFNEYIYIKRLTVCPAGLQIFISLNLYISIFLQCLVSREVHRLLFLSFLLI